MYSWFESLYKQPRWWVSIGMYWVAVVFEISFGIFSKCEWITYVILDSGNLIQLSKFYWDANFLKILFLTPDFKTWKVFKENFENWTWLVHPEKAWKLVDYVHVGRNRKDSIIFVLDNCERNSNCMWVQECSSLLLKQIFILMLFSNSSLQLFIS